MSELNDQNSQAVPPNYFQTIAMREMSYLNQIEVLKREILILRQALKEKEETKES